MPSNPHLTDEFYDPITHEYFCAECENLLERQGVVVSDHVLGVWRHYGTLRYPGRKAIDAQGRTIETEWATPPRTVRVLIPIQTHLRFCVGCFPFTDIVPSGCNECAAALEDDDVTHGEFLWKWKNGYNGPFKQGKIHLSCLPKHFDKLHSYRLEKIELKEP